MLARIAGLEPFDPAPVDIRVEPGGTLYQTHPTLGYISRPGRYRVTIPGLADYRATHLADGLRATASDDAVATNAALPGDAPMGDDMAASGGTGIAAEGGASTGLQEAASIDDRPAIWIAGCSFTYGMNVDDEQSYPWRLQARLPQYHVINLGVPGYGTVHNLVAIESRLAAGERPAAVMVAYHHRHDERNTFLRRRRKLLVPFSRLGTFVQPVARIDAAGQLELTMAEAVYVPWPLIGRSAVVHALETRYNDWEERRTDSHRVSQEIVRRLAHSCRAVHVRLGLVGLDRTATTADMLRFCGEIDLPAASIAFDPADPDLVLADGHPSPLGQAELAIGAAWFLELVLLRDDFTLRLTDPEHSADTHIELARCHLERSQRAAGRTSVQLDRHAAIERLQAALALRADDAVAHLLLGDALVLNDEFEPAVRHYRQALRIEPSEHQAARALALILATASDPRLRNPVEAVRLAESAVAVLDTAATTRDAAHSSGAPANTSPPPHGTLSDDLPAVLEVLAISYAAAGRPEDATAAAQRAIDAALGLGRPHLAARLTARYASLGAAPSSQSIDP